MYASPARHQDIQHPTCLPPQAKLNPFARPLWPLEGEDLWDSDPETEAGLALEEMGLLNVDDELAEVAGYASTESEDLSDAYDEDPPAPLFMHTILTSIHVPFPHYPIPIPIMIQGNGGHPDGQRGSS